MSVYSLENQSTFNYYNKNRELLLDSSNKEFINKYFLIGEKTDKKEQQFYLVMNELLCAENCELTKYINDTIQGKFLKKLKPLKLTTIDENVTIVNNITQVIDHPMIWGDETVSW